MYVHMLLELRLMEELRAIRMQFAVSDRILGKTGSGTASCILMGSIH
jgi:hypothetical protein